jgi:NADP-dependent 3-hydroxy acid dehydrogenase YdfG
VVIYTPQLPLIKLPSNRILQQVDVRNHKSIQDAVDATILQFGQSGILVASAGIAE